MKKIDATQQNIQNGGFKVLYRQHFIETVDQSGQVIHYIDLSYAKADIIYHGWVGYRTNIQMKEILAGHFRDIYNDYRCRCMLTDCSKMKGDFSEAVEWYNSSLGPDLASLGLEYNAIILPNDNLAQISVREWQKNSRGFKNVTFAGLNDAINWLALL